MKKCGSHRHQQLSHACVGQDRGDQTETHHESWLVLLSKEIPNLFFVTDEIDQVKKCPTRMCVYTHTVHIHIHTASYTHIYI